MNTERNPNFPSDISVHENGEIDAYYAGYEYRPELGRYSFNISISFNGRGEEVVYHLKPGAPLAVWLEDNGVITYEVKLFLGHHNKTEEPFCLYTKLECGYDDQIGDYTEAWSIHKAQNE